MLSEHRLVYGYLVTNTHEASPFREIAADKLAQGCNQVAASGLRVCLVFCTRRGFEDPARAASRIAVPLAKHRSSESRGCLEEVCC